jgi:hypothetical protein
MKISGKLQARPLCPGEIAKDIHYIGGWVDTRARLEPPWSREQFLAPAGNQTLAVKLAACRCAN